MRTSGVSTPDARWRIYRSPAPIPRPDLISGIANSTYNALQTSLRKQFSHGLLISRVLHLFEDPRRCFYLQHYGLGFAKHRGRERPGAEPLRSESRTWPFHVRCAAPLRHQLSMEPAVVQPSGELVRTHFGQLDGQRHHHLHDNTPFTVYDSSNVSLQGSAPEISGFPGNRPDVVGNPNVGPQHRTGGSTSAHSSNWIPFCKPASLAMPGAISSTAPRINSGTSLQSRIIPIRESMNLQFRAEFFNIFNNVNFLLPVNDINSPNFGQISAARPGRIVQLALKFSF